MAEQVRQQRDQWQVGAVSVTRIVELEVPVPVGGPRAMIVQATAEGLRRRPWLYPHFVTEEDQLMTSVHALVVRTPSCVIVVDTCIGNDKPRRMTGMVALQGPFLRHLEAAGFPREQVDFVVCTHLHVDHVGWNTMREGERWVPTFPRARYLIGREEMEHWQADEAGEQSALLDDSIKPILDAGLADLVEVDHRICPEVCLRPSPGHTPGHVSLEIMSEGKRALITGDIMHHPCQVAYPTWHTRFDSDTDAATATRQRLLAELADSDTLVIGTHFAHPTAGRVRTEAGDYHFDTSPFSGAE